MPAPAIKASVLVNITSYHLAYVLALAVALGIMAWDGQASALVFIATVLFLLFSIGLSVTVLVLSGHSYEPLARTLHRPPVVRTARAFLGDADARLVRNSRMLAQAIGLQETIVLLDAATVWILILALGARASVGGVFASFMIASLFGTMGVLPGELGTFEATSVLTLRMAGVDIPVALSATLIPGPMLATILGMFRELVRYESRKFDRDTEA